MLFIFLQLTSNALAKKPKCLFLNSSTSGAPPHSLFHTMNREYIRLKMQIINHWLIDLYAHAFAHARVQTAIR